MKWQALIHFKDDEEISAIHRDTPGEALRDLEALMDDEDFQGIEYVQFMQIEPVE